MGRLGLYVMDMNELRLYLWEFPCIYDEKLKDIYQKFFTVGLSS